MLEITIKLIPYGIQSESHVLTEKLYIWNTGKGNIETGEYECCFGSDKKVIDQVPNKSVKGHKRIDGAWPLVYKCLRKYYAKK